jgi:hypothetical protein
MCGPNKEQGSAIIEGLKVKLKVKVKIIAVGSPVF